MQAQAVKQLRLICRHQRRQAGHISRFGVGVIGVQRAGHGLQHGHALQHRTHFFKGGGRAQAVQAQHLRGLNNGFAVALGQRFEQAKHIRAVHTAQHQTHGGFLQLAGTKGNRLVGQAQGIAHGTARRARHQTQRLHIGRHIFGLQHLLQVLTNGLGRHGPQVELQAAREHGHRHFLRVGRGQHKLQVLGRLFQRFQHGVERRVGEHVHLVNHEHLEAALHRFVNRLLQQCLHLVHTAVTGGVQLGVIHESSTVNISAGLAYTTRRSGDAASAINALAIERLGQNTRHRGFTHATGACEQIRVVQTLGRERIAQGLNHMVLPHHFSEVAGAVLAGEHEIRHSRQFYGAGLACFSGRQALKADAAPLQYLLTGLPAW